MTEHEKYLTPTEIIDSNHSDIIRFAQKHSREDAEPVEQAVGLYYAVRDGIWYDPYYPFYLPEHYRASIVFARHRCFAPLAGCVKFRPGWDLPMFEITSLRNS